MENMTSNNLKQVRKKLILNIKIEIGNLPHGEKSLTSSR